MSYPDPHPGLVIRYAYLWKREHEEGREDGSKDRPCAIVLSIAEEDREREGGYRNFGGPTFQLQQ